MFHYILKLKIVLQNAKELLLKALAQNNLFYVTFVSKITIDNPLLINQFFNDLIYLFLFPKDKFLKTFKIRVGLILYNFNFLN